MRQNAHLSQSSLYTIKQRLQKRFYRAREANDEETADAIAEDLLAIRRFIEQREAANNGETYEEPDELPEEQEGISNTEALLAIMNTDGDDQ